MDQVTADKLAIREIVEQWVIYSDSGDWERFAALWHDGAWMSATWFQAPATEFVRARREGFDKGVSIIHFLGAFTCDVAGDRAISQTKMTISQRAPVDGALADVTCTGRFYDFFERRDGRWGMVRRQPIYEKDRIDFVGPGPAPELDPELLARFPDGYRHLGYLQTQVGYPVKERGMPGLKGPEVERLYAEGRAWLEGSERPGEPA
ncbi:MAG: nuclear transport factor 2 family protein [Thermoleophilia bacterium]